jgi:hypothetical protein
VGGSPPHGVDNARADADPHQRGSHLRAVYDAVVAGVVVLAEVIRDQRGEQWEECAAAEFTPRRRGVPVCRGPLK